MRIRIPLTLAILAVSYTAFSWSQESTDVNKWMPTPGITIPPICVAKINADKPELTISLLLPMQPGSYPTVSVSKADANGKQPAITESKVMTLEKLEMLPQELLVTDYNFQTVGGKTLDIEQVKILLATPKHVVLGTMPQPYYAEVLKAELLVITPKPTEGTGPGRLLLSAPKR